MSKVFHFLAVSLFILVFLLIKTEPVFAQDDWDVKLSPDPVPVDAGRVTITVTRIDNTDFFIQPNYTMVAWTGKLVDDPQDRNKCKIISRRNGFNGDYYLGDLAMTKTTATASWDFSDRTWSDFPSSCKQPGTQWHFRLFVGDNGTAMMNSSTGIIDDSPFTLVQAGGLNPVRIEAKNNGDVYATQQPTVIISNAVSGADYSFWWDGDKAIPGSPGIAGYYQRDKNPANPVEIIIPNFSTDISPRKLCMEYGNHSVIPAFNDCNPYATFNFKVNQLPPVTPVGSVKCTIDNTIPINSDANIKIEGLASGTKVSAYAIDQNKTTPEPTVTGTTNGNSITLTLLKKASTVTTYAVAAYTESDPSKNICPNTTFTTGGAFVAEPTDQCKDPNNTNCSKAGGDPCGSDINNPGFKTAIGCIHTTPKALVEDVLKFATGIGGGLAFIMMLFGAFQMMTSGGNPQNLQGGRDVFQNAIIGLLFIIFSILLMKIIGIDILNIPGFS